MPAKQKRFPEKLPIKFKVSRPFWRRLSSAVASSGRDMNTYINDALQHEMDGTFVPVPPPYHNAGPRHKVPPEIVMECLFPSPVHHVHQSDYVSTGEMQLPLQLPPLNMVIDYEPPTFMDCEGEKLTSWEAGWAELVPRLNTTDGWDIFQRMLRGARPPGAFLSWSEQNQITWLKEHAPL